jgi:hypothetical protein
LRPRGAWSISQNKNRPESKFGSGLLAAYNVIKKATAPPSPSSLREAQARHGRNAVITLSGKRKFMPDQLAPEYKDADRRSGPHQENTERARAGVTGHNVRYVLSFGLIGVIVAFAIAYAFYFH